MTPYHFTVLSEKELDIFFPYGFSEVLANFNTIAINIFHKALILKESFSLMYVSSFITIFHVYRVTSDSKKTGQTAVLYHYCGLSRFS